MKKQQVTKERDIKIGILDFLLGFIVATALTDWVVQPLFDNPDRSYGMKLIIWLLVTVIFLLISAFVIFVSLVTRNKLKKRRR